MNLIFLCFDICNYICLDTSDHFSVLISQIFFIFFKYSCTNIFHRRSLYTFYQICKPLFVLSLLLVSSRGFKLIPGRPKSTCKCCRCVWFNKGTVIYFYIPYIPPSQVVYFLFWFTAVFSCCSDRHRTLYRDVHGPMLWGAGDTSLGESCSSVVHYLSPAIELQSRASVHQEDAVLSVYGFPL